VFVWTRRNTQGRSLAKHQTSSGYDLFPAAKTRRRLDDFLTRALSEATERVVRGPVTPTFDLGAFRRELGEFDFENPLPVDEILSWVIAQMEHGLVHVTHPRYFGLFNPAPTFPSRCADRIVAEFNPQLATSTTSPAAVEIESHVIRAIARRAGFPEHSAGNFTTGGAEANYTALLCALTQANSRFAAEGARVFSGPPTFYVSRESHIAWLKIAHQAGIGRDAVRLVATDGNGRMDAVALANAVKADQARGHIPIMIAATAGTTNAGMIDPLKACAEIARLSGVWYHVDAAWGGAAIASERLRHALAGIAEADSITIDGHKWFATTMGCGMFITKHASSLASVFHVASDFMPSNFPSFDPYVTSIQWSRRFLGLRLFLSLAVAGWEGYAKHVERSAALTEELKQKLSALGWTIANDPSLAVLCIEPPANFGKARAIVDRILLAGRVWVSVATFEGREIIRACVAHGETSMNDITELVSALQEAGESAASP
jgi:glutamate/tyrosine decarboxylase-like PLP-dependent enzyme